MKSSSSLVVRPLIFLILILLLGGAGAFFLLEEGSNDGPVRDVIIPRRTPLVSVAEILHQQGILRRPVLFKWLLRFTNGAAKVRAGEFRFHEDMPAIRALSILYRGEPILHQVTIPEGWTVRQIAQLLSNEGLVDEKRFLALALGPNSAAKYHLKSPHLEGFLFPDTYGFSKIDGEERIIDQMVQHLLRIYEKDFKTEVSAAGWSLEQWVTFASIIEKETGAPEERPLVSSVFHNRIKKRMRFQSDPTTIYGISDFNGNLKKADLQRYTPYNTYVIPGLPPGPISNPGFESLKAALHPAQTEYLYFVSNNQGHHVFSETYLQHAKRVNTYQVRNHRRLPRNIGTVRR